MNRRSILGSRGFWRSWRRAGYDIAFRCRRASSKPASTGQRPFFVTAKDGTSLFVQDAGSLCAGHAQQLGSESLLPNLMEVKGWQVQPKLFQPTRQDDHCFSDCTVFVIQILDDADVVFRISDAEFADVLRFYPRGHHARRAEQFV